MTKKREFLHEYFGIKESFKLPPLLMDVVLDPERLREFQTLCFDFEDDNESTSRDFFVDYFQDEQGDRNALKQDFTPPELCDLVAQLGKGGIVYDICAGTGGLALAIHNMYGPNLKLICEELSERALPFLLFNLAYNFIHATVLRKDVLTGEVMEAYKVFSTHGQGMQVKKIEPPAELPLADCVVMNPPYSMQWNPVMDKRFEKFGLAPKSKSDYAFLLDGLSRIKEDGHVLAILPHGILFRGASEGKIRQALIDSNCIDAVIGLPDKLFLNTGIPVAIVSLKKNSDKLLFVDASREYMKNSKQNVLTHNNIEKIKAAYKLRLPVVKYSEIVNKDAILQNEYNLNIPRYVDTFEPEVLPDMLEVDDRLQAIEKNITSLEYELNRQILQLESTSHDPKFQEYKRRLKERMNIVD